MIRPQASRSSSHRDERVGGVSGLTRHARTRVLVDENGTESGDVDAQISATDLAWTLQVTNMFHSWTHSLSGTCFLGAVPVACLWLSLWVWAWSLLVSVSVTSGSVSFWWGPTPKKERAPFPKPVVICDHFRSGIPFCTMFWDFGSLHQKHRASAGHMVVVRRDSSDGWRSPAPPGRQYWGVEVVYFLRQPSGVSPADRSRTF